MEVAQSIGSRLAGAVVAAEVDGQVCDVVRPLAELSSSRPIPLRLLTEQDPPSVDVLRHSLRAHVMARAVMRLFPGVSLAFGPTIDNGFYYDFDLPHKISEEDFPRIEAEMAQIVKRRRSRSSGSTLRATRRPLCGDLKQTSKSSTSTTGLQRARPP